MILFPGRHLMGVLECYQLTPLNKMVELKTHKLWCQYNGCTHCVNSNESSREDYSSRQTLYVVTLTLNKKQKMKIMSRVAQLILLVVVSVCVLCFVFCAVSKTIWCSQVSPISYFKKWKLWAMYFGGFLCRSNYNRKKIRPEKKVQSSGRRLE